jgi:hypothetical protein
MDTILPLRVVTRPTTLFQNLGGKDQNVVAWVAVVGSGPGKVYPSGQHGGAVEVVEQDGTVVLTCTLCRDNVLRVEPPANGSLAVVLFSGG